MDRFDLRVWDGFERALKGSCDSFFIEDVVCDSRQISSKPTLFVALPGRFTDGHAHLTEVFNKKAAFALVKKGNYLSQETSILEVDDPLLALQEIALAYRNQKKAKVVAIAGSSLKTTLKEILLALTGQSFNTFASKESFNSQLGVALSLFGIKETHDLALIEAGFSKPFELERLRKIINPDSVLITSVERKPLAGFSSLKETLASYLALTENLKGVCQIPKELEGAQGIFHETANSPLKIAIQFAKLLGVKEEKIEEILPHIHPEVWQTEMWKTEKKVTLINDTVAEDPQSIRQSLQALPSIKQGKRVFIFSGFRGKENNTLENIKKVVVAVDEAKVDEVHLIAPFETPLFGKKGIQQTHLESCLKSVAENTSAGDTVLIKGCKKYPLSTLIPPFSENGGPNRFFIHLGNVKKNLNTLRSSLPKKTKIMVMVKALAYGTDDHLMTSFLRSEGVSAFGVSTVNEALLLRKSGIEETLFVLNALEEEMAPSILNNLELGISDESFLLALERAADSFGKKATVHLHIDTGMGRFGCRKEEALKIARLAKNSPHIHLKGIFTHLSSADDPAQDPFTEEQLQIFNDVVEELKKEGIVFEEVHVANSSAAARFSKHNFTMVRVGVALFGLSASSIHAPTLPLRPAITLTSKLVGINRLKPGDSLGYGRSFIAKEDTLIGVIPLGYFDGFHTSYSQKTYVLIRGKKAPLVGRICMDFAMIDLKNVPHPEIGEQVLIFGEDGHGNCHSLEAFAGSCGSIPHELMTCLGPRIQRIFIY